MARILVIRLSAIGDVAMSVPVIYSAAHANPDDSFTVLTQAFLCPLFLSRPSNVEVLGINTKTTEKSLGGLLRFTSALSEYKFDKVLDLHHVLRTIVIRTILRLSGARIYVVDKGRKERAALISLTQKRFLPLRPMTERYADVFHWAGISFSETFISLFQAITPGQTITRPEPIAVAKQGKWIGIAPFAKHEGKIYPIDQMEEVVAHLSKREDVTLFLFGGKGYEEAILDQWAYQHERVESVVGKSSLDRELALIGQLDVLLCMDSANMHFASLVGTRVISIWGATHPYTGFYGYRQNPADCIQIDLPCRPCSVFGEKRCHRGDWACMRQITPEQIIQKVETVLNETAPDGNGD